MKVRSHKYLPNFALISIIIATLMVFPLGCEEKPREQMPFNIAIASWVGFAPFYIAVDKGFFNEEGLNAKVLMMVHRFMMLHFLLIYTKNSSIDQEIR